MNSRETLLLSLFLLHLSPAAWIPALVPVEPGLLWRFHPHLELISWGVLVDSVSLFLQTCGELEARKKTNSLQPSLTHESVCLSVSPSRTC